MARNSKTYVRALMAQKSYLIVYRPLMERIGLINAVLLSLLIDRSDVLCKDDENNDGWFYLYADYIQQSLCIGRRPIDTSVKELEDMDFIETKRCGLPPKKYYKVNWDNIAELLDTLNEPSECANLCKTHKLNCTDCTDSDVQNVQVINKKNNKEEYIPPVSIETSPKVEDNHPEIDKQLSLFEQQGYEIASGTKEALSTAFDEIESSFNQFWETYDKKCGKVQARNIWGRLTRKDRQAILDYLPGYIQSTPDKQFRMNPTTFLNPSRRRWEDEIINKKENGNNTGNSILSTNFERIHEGAKVWDNFFHS